MGEYNSFGLNEFGPKRINNPVDVGRQFRECWDSQIWLGENSLIDCYFAGKLKINLLFRIGCLDSKEFGAVFDGDGSIDCVSELKSFPFDIIRVHSHTYVSSRRADMRLSDNEKSVLVGVIQFLKHPEGIELRGGSSLKWLQLSNEFCGSGADSLYHSWRSGFITVRGGEYRKPTFGGRGFTVVCNQLPNEVIERRSLLIQRLSDGQTDFWGNWLAVVENGIKPLELGIVLSSDSVGVIFPECLEGILEITDMMIGPFDL
jgi:hypothetical protein